MLVDVNRIIDAVELDRFPKRRFNHFRVAVHLDRQTADLVEAIEGPGRLARRVLRPPADGPGDCDCCECDSVSCCRHDIRASSWCVLATVLPLAALSAGQS